MSKRTYNVYELEGWVQVAYDAYLEARDEKAFRILQKAIKLYAQDIPAYIYYEYYDLWSAFEEEYEVDYEIEKMTEDELSARISDAVQRNRSCKKHSKSFRREARHIFEDYLEDKISNDNMRSRIALLEKKHLSNEVYTSEFEEEIVTIFRAYFHGSEVIDYLVVSMYERYFREFFDCEIFEEQWRRHAEKVIETDESWPKAMKCAVQQDAQGKDWRYIYIDPTIQSDMTSKNYSGKEEINMLALIRSMIRFEPNYIGKSGLHQGCHIISNWRELTQQYPGFVEKFVERGKKYCVEREEHMKKARLEQEQTLLSIPLDERKKIVRIWNDWDNKWIHVVN